MTDADSIQYRDRNASKRDYAILEDDEVLVSKTFFTIQGEGPFAGERAFFIRLAGCNRGDKRRMGCAFCDADFRIANGVRGKASTLCDLAEKHLGGSEGLVVITGGEPMLQKNLCLLCGALLDRGFRVQIESNGDLLAPGMFRLLDVYDGKQPSLTLVVSPKVNPHSLRYNKLERDVARSLDYLKILFDTTAGSPYGVLPDYLDDFPGRVFIQPVARYLCAVPVGVVADAWFGSYIDRDATKVNYREAAGICMERGYRLSAQTHLFAVVE